VQTGLFAPAAAFPTRVFRHFHYVGEGAAQDARGLSGFGREIAQFNAAWADFQQPTLALFDEFARTTQSQEAEALLSAAQEAMIALPAVLALFSTHFRGVRRFQGARYLRMGGLDRAGLERAEDAAIEARIRLINRHMDYRLMADDGSRASDALTVAALLGLDPGISRKAETYLNLDH
jgi:DNA mismatch repair ATPase MutS